MDELERTIKGLPLARPPRDLEQRIFGEPARAPRWTPGLWLSRPVRLGWALGFGLLMSAAGFWAAWQGGRKDAQSNPNEVEVRIVESRSDRNNFDFTADGAATGFLGGQISMDVQVEGVI